VGTFMFVYLHVVGMLDLGGVEKFLDFSLGAFWKCMVGRIAHNKFMALSLALLLLLSN
jgi:hypothetical protein